MAALPEALAGQAGPLRLLVAGDGAVVVGSSRSGVPRRAGPRPAERLDLLSGLTALRANDFLRDREGLVWIAGDRGLSRLVSRRFATYRRRHGLLENEVAAIAEASPGVLVLGHNDGLSVLAGKELRTHRLPAVAGRSADEPAGAGSRARRTWRGLGGRHRSGPRPSDSRRRPAMAPSGSSVG